MRQSYLKNAALLTGSDVVLRLAGMGLRIWLANELGGEGMGLYQLVLAVYSLFVTLATAGVSVAATRLMAEELSGPASARGAARGMLRHLLAAGLVLGLFAAALQLATADLAARCWLGDVRAAGALRVSALGMPWMAVSAVLRGFFIARRHVAPNVFSQLTEQTVRIALVALALTRTEGLAVGVRCMLVLGATAVSEAVSALCMLVFYRRDARSAFAGQKAVCPADPARRLWEILWPVEGGRVLASALHTAENMLVPACLAVYLINAGGRTAALEQYGELKGMALPLLTFPFGLLGSLSVLLMPEITQAHILGQTERLNALLNRMLRLTGFFSALAAALFWCWGPDAAGLLYGSAEAGFYLQVLAPVLPLLYLESMVKEQMNEHRYLHSQSVAQLCVELAQAHGLDTRAAYIMGIAHDVCKQLPYEKAKAWMRAHMPDHLEEAAAIWHGYIGADYVNKVFHIRDRRILQAIYHHVKGRNRTDFDRILFIADKLDPSRGYDSRREIEISRKSLREGYRVVKQQQEAYLRKEGTLK